MNKAGLNRNEMPLPNRKIWDLATERTSGNVSALADMIGIKQQSLDRLFKIDKRSGKYPSVSSEIKKALFEKLGVSEIDLLTDIQQEQPEISYTKGRPYYNVDFVGGFDLVINDQTRNPDYLIDFQKYKEADCWCNISGHSMEPLISSGDIIALKEMKDWRDFLLFGEVYGIITDDMRTVKTVTKSQKGEDFLQLVPENKSEEYQPQDIPVKLIRKVFKVLGCMKKL